MNIEQLRNHFMDLIFFAQRMTFVEVVVERDGFRLSNPQTHTHLVYVADIENHLKNQLDQLKDFILMAHEYNEQNIETKTHEELKAQGLSSADFICSGGSANKSLLSKAQREEYLNKIKNIQQG